MFTRLFTRRPSSRLRESGRGAKPVRGAARSRSGLLRQQLVRGLLHCREERHDSDFQEPYRKAALGMVGLAADLTFLHTEMTKSAHVPRLAQFRQIAADSYLAALDGARRHATT
ncbi:hypothetical protein [Streptomyces triticagri]|uniref:hypothetical protein n=1 Tax=Streptomyces triticagri TaxID=2293568 RepID=UPI0018F59C2E|nr:hypothetical protein [Streptomyces triticagri]